MRLCISDSLTVINAMILCVSRSVMSNSLRPYGLQPSTLLRPRDFPGKNTAVGCQVLLQMIVCHLHIFTSEVIFLQNLADIIPGFACLC